MQEFDLEIKDKKGSENVVADHMSRIELSPSVDQQLAINEYFPDEQLLQVIDLPWFADIVNYLAVNVLPNPLTYQ